MNLDDLNPEQKDAVLTTEGRVLILAGAGSGKTKVLTYRMAHLIQGLNTPPQAILGLTFTNKAAAEMRKRLGALVGTKQAAKTTLSTFHSFCLRVLREEIHHLGFTKNFSLYDEGDVVRMAKVIARDLLEREGDLPSLAPTLSLISKARSKGLDSSLITDNNEWHQNFTRTLFDRLQEGFRAYNALDFDSLLTETVRLFEKHPEVLQRYQQRFQYVMIDEYQDTNPIQYRLAELLTDRSRNLCVVGDDDQSIYGWRGAEVKNILNFDQAKVIKLEQNYRSTNTILEAANHVIKLNTTRHSKRLWSKKGLGAKIEVFHAPTDLEEAQSIAFRIAKLKEEFNVPWSHFAVLYRSNRLSRQMELALIKQPWKRGDSWVNGIPYQIYGGEEFFERKEVKDLLAYMRVALNPLDEAALLRIINYPRRGIGEGTLDKLTQYNRVQKLPLIHVLKNLPESIEITPKTKQSIHDFIDLIDSFERHLKTSAVDALKTLVDRISLKKAIEEEVKSDKMRLFKWENVEELMNAVANAPGDLTNFIAETLLENQNNFRNDDMKDAVNLMTFHSAKGLEFPHCYLIGLEDHIIPHERSLKEGSIDEERRLMYVALTRAQEKLTLSMARQRPQMGQTINSQPSRFLLDIPKELLNVIKWDSL
jgi:DNA helicase-2/ATP-dependent DNA helicase PcrA